MTAVHVIDFLCSDHIISTQLRYSDGQSFADSLILLSKVNVLFFEGLNLRLDFRYDLIFLIHLDDWLIADVHCSGCIVQS